MSKYQIVEYSPKWFIKWNKFIEESNNGTIFHRLDFLDYHGDRYKTNINHLIWLKGEEIFALIPMSIFHYKDKAVAKSPYGASFGGIVTKKALNNSECKEIVSSLNEYLIKKKIKETLITLPTKNLEKTPSDTMLFNLLSKGFKIINSDILNIVMFDKNINNNSMFTSRARNMSKKAIKANVNVKFRQDIDDFWPIMKKTYSKIGKPPTHSYEEWKYLNEKFPDYFWNDIAYLNNKPVAGIGHAKLNSTTDSSFYLCSDYTYKNTQALSYLITASLQNSKASGFKFFDFGSSSIGMVANDNLFKFKESFNAKGFLKHTIKLKLF